MCRLATALLTLLLLAGCADRGSASDVPEGTVTAFTSVYALSWIGEQVAPEASFTSLGAGGDPHDAELSSAQREAIGSSDVVLYLGDLEFQPQVEQAVASSQGRVVAAAEVVGESALIEHGEDEEDEEGGDHGDEHGTVDPHMWFDPALMAEVARATGEAFAEADPEGAEQYRANAERVAAELADLDAEIDALFADCERDEAVVSHEAYAYLLEPRAKHQVGIAGLAPEAGATSADLGALVEEVQKQGITTVLAEPQEGRADAEALAAETGIDLVEINPLESVDERQAAAGYPALLRQQAEAFATAFACA